MKTYTFLPKSVAREWTIGAIFMKLGRAPQTQQIFSMSSVPPQGSSHNIGRAEHTPGARLIYTHIIDPKWVRLQQERWCPRLGAGAR